MHPPAANVTSYPRKNGEENSRTTRETLPAFFAPTFLASHTSGPPKERKKKRGGLRTRRTNQTPASPDARRPPGPARLTTAFPAPRSARTYESASLDRPAQKSGQPRVGPIFASRPAPKRGNVADQQDPPGRCPRPSIVRTPPQTPGATAGLRGGPNFVDFPRPPGLAPPRPACYPCATLLGHACGCRPSYTCDGGRPGCRSGRLPFPPRPDW